MSPLTNGNKLLDHGSSSYGERKQGNDGASLNGL